MERYVSGGRGEVAVIVAAAVALAGLAALVAGRLGQFLRLLLQQLIQRFFQEDEDSWETEESDELDADGGGDEESEDKTV